MIPMSRRNLCQPSFVDAMVSGWGKSGGFLDRIVQAFEALAFADPDLRRGAPGYPPLALFKILLCSSATRCLIRALRRRFGDRLSFRRVSWLALWGQDAGPRFDLALFGQTIERLGLSAVLLAERNRQLDALGLIVKRGTLVDATLIEAAVKRPP
jgi:transposase, IS5 family